MISLTKVDEHARIEYKTSYLLIVSFIAVVLNLLIGGSLLYVTEAGKEGSNIVTFEDAVWLTYMMISTVGFGDHFPVTSLGRLVGGLCVLVGAINLGTFIKIGSQLIKTDDAVSNRQLMTVVVEQTRMLQEFEKVLNSQREVTKDTHMLDTVFTQTYNENNSKKVCITSGQDSSEMLILSLEVQEGVNISKRWLKADNQEHLDNLEKHYKDLYNLGEK